MMTDVSPGPALEQEDAKLVTLARAARARIGAPGGAALRDETGRTFASADVTLGPRSLPGLVLVVAQAVASGSTGAEAAVVVGPDPAEADLEAVRALSGAGTPVLVCDPDGTVRRRLST